MRAHHAHVWRSGGKWNMEIHSCTDRLICKAKGLASKAEAVGAAKVWTANIWQPVPLREKRSATRMRKTR